MLGVLWVTVTWAALFAYLELYPSFLGRQALEVCPSQGTQLLQFLNPRPHTSLAGQHNLLALEELKVLKGKKAGTKIKHDTDFNTTQNWQAGFGVTWEPAPPYKFTISGSLAWSHFQVNQVGALRQRSTALSPVWGTVYPPDRPWLNSRDQVKDVPFLWLVTGTKLLRSCWKQVKPPWAIPAGLAQIGSVPLVAKGYSSVLTQIRQRAPSCVPGKSADRL